MPSGKAGHGVRVQNAGAWNATVQQRGETRPSHLSALAAADQNAPPQPTNAPGKGAQLSRVARNSMVLVVAQHSLAKPCTDVGCAMMLPALKFGLKGFELRDHPLLRRDPVHPIVQIDEPILQSGCILLPRHTIDSWRSLPLKGVEALAQ